jgi:chromosome segregation ATPase
MADTRDIEARLRWAGTDVLLVLRRDASDALAAQRAKIERLSADLAAEQEHHQRAIVEHQAQLAAQQAKIERLEQERGCLAFWHDHEGDHWTPLGEQIRQLEAKLAEARREKIGRLTTRIRQLERGYDLLRTNLHRTEAQLAKAQRDKQTILERNNRRLAELQAQLAEAQERAEEIVFSALHEVFAVCGHCGKRKCPERKSNSRLPDEIFKPIRAALDAATGRGR